MSNDKCTNSKKIIKAGAGYVIGNYLLKGITFLSAPIFSRLLSTSDFGEFNTYLSYESIIYILVGLALHTSINTAKYKYKDNLDSYVSSIVLLILINTSIWYIGGNVFFHLYEKQFGFSRLVLNILIFHCLCSSLLQVFNIYVGITYSVKSFLVITAFNGIANIIVSVLLIVSLFGQNRSLGRIFGTVIPLGIIGIYLIAFFFRKAKPMPNLSYWKYGLLYSLPIVPHGISQVILSSFDRIMIRDMIGSAEAGIYSFAYTIYSLFNVAANSLGNVWKPWVFECMHVKDFDSLRKQGTRYVFGMALFASLIIIVSPEMIMVLGPEEYWQSTTCVIPVILGGFFSFLYTLPSLIEYFYEKTKYVALGSICAASLNIVLNYIFMKHFGYIAAAYTTLVTYILYFIFHYYLAKKIHGSVIFNTRAIVIISVSVIIVGVFSLLLEKQWYIRWGVELIIGVLAFYWANVNFDVINRVKSIIHKNSIDDRRKV